MAQFEVYKVLAHSTRRLCAAIDAETDDITVVRNAAPVVIQDAALRTAVQSPPTPKPKPVICARCHSVQCHCGQEPKPPLAARPHGIRTMREAKAAVLQAMMQDVPPMPSLDQIIARQRELGLR